MKSTVNTRIKMLRTSLRLTQNEFANELGMSPSLISKIEAGEKPSLGTINTIIDIYSVPEDWITEGVGEMSFRKPEKKQSTFDPAVDTLYNEMKEQIAFLRETIRGLTGRGSFRNRLLQAPEKSGSRRKLANA